MKKGEPPSDRVTDGVKDKQVHREGLLQSKKCAVRQSVYCFQFAFVVVKGLLEHLFADRVKTGTAGKSLLYFSRLFSKAKVL